MLILHGFISVKDPSENYGPFGQGSFSSIKMEWLQLKGGGIGK